MVGGLPNGVATVELEMGADGSHRSILHFEKSTMATEWRTGLDRQSLSDHSNAHWATAVDGLETRLKAN